MEMFHGISACGGIAGEAYGNIYHCFSKGTIRGYYNFIGGILGLATAPIQVDFVQGLADVYKGDSHVEAAAWGKNYSGGLYGRLDNISFINHSYVRGVYTINSLRVV